MEISSSLLQRTSVLFWSLLVLLVAPASASEQPVSKPTDVPAIVIAHLVLPQETGSQMLFKKENSKQSLYVKQAPKPGFIIVHLSKPEQPSLLKRNAEANQATPGNLRI